MTDDYREPRAFLLYSGIRLKNRSRYDDCIKMGHKERKRIGKGETGMSSELMTP